MTENTDPCCDTCGAEITTGMMAAYCDRREHCEFWPADADAASMQLMRWMRGEVASPVGSVTTNRHVYARDRWEHLGTPCDIVAYQVKGA